jgi:hypothetical protein
MTSVTVSTVETSDQFLLLVLILKRPKCRNSCAGEIISDPDPIRCRHFGSGSTTVKSGQSKESLFVLHCSVPVASQIFKEILHLYAAR